MTTLDILQDRTNNLIDPHLLAASMVEKDTMYYVQAMKAYDAANFVKAIEKEVNDLNSTGVWRWVKKSDVPENTKFLPYLEFQTKKIPLAN